MDQITYKIEYYEFRILSKVDEPNSSYSSSSSNKGGSYNTRKQIVGIPDLRGTRKDTKMMKIPQKPKVAQLVILLLN